MNDTRELSQQGRNTPLAFLNQTSLARWAPIPLRLMLGYSRLRPIEHGLVASSGLSSRRRAWIWPQTWSRAVCVKRALRTSEQSKSGSMRWNCSRRVVFAD
jgi:hypothetical protein